MSEQQAIAPNPSHPAGRRPARALVRQAQAILDCTQAELARMLGVHARTLAGWANEERLMPLADRILLELLVSGVISGEHIHG